VSTWRCFVDVAVDAEHAFVHNRTNHFCSNIINQNRIYCSNNNTSGGSSSSGLDYHARVDDDITSWDHVL